MKDVNKNGVIMYTEFIAATLEAQGHIEEERVAEAFDRLDSDDSGFISRANLTEFLGADASSSDIQELINDIDKDGDGQSMYKKQSQLAYYISSLADPFAFSSFIPRIPHDVPR